MSEQRLKPYLLEHIQCPACHGELAFIEDASAPRFVCANCELAIPSQPPGANGHAIPLFTPPPSELAPSEKIERGPEMGTPWRQANWRFLQEQIAQAVARDPQALMLDVGAGRGDFAAIFEGRRCLALDIYPYPEIDLVCDLTQVNPLKPGSFEAIALMNVLEHVYDTQALLAALGNLLKPGGRLIVAIPFLVKIHQAPLDFVRYTHYALERLGRDHGLEVELLEGYYDPLFFLGEGIGNLRWSFLPGLPGVRRYLGRFLLAVIQGISNALGALLGKGAARSPDKVRSMAPTGYHVVYIKT